MKFNFIKLSVMLAIVAGLTSCSKSNNSAYMTSVSAATVQLATSAKFGSILTDKTGRTLYSFAVDAAAQSNCNGNCAVTWPVFMILPRHSVPALKAQILALLPAPTIANKPPIRAGRCITGMKTWLPATSRVTASATSGTLL